MAYVTKKDKAFEDASANPWVIRRRSDGRIKMFRSTGDVRAWSHCKEDRRQYILDVIIADIKKCAGSLIPLDLLAKALLACQGGAGGGGAEGGITRSLSSGAGKTKIRKGPGSIDKGDETLTSEKDSTMGGESGLGDSIAGVTHTGRSTADDSALGGSKLDKSITDKTVVNKPVADKKVVDKEPKSGGHDSGVGKTVTLTSGPGEMRTGELGAGGKLLGVSDVGGKKGEGTGIGGSGADRKGLVGTGRDRAEKNEGEEVGAKGSGTKSKVVAKTGSEGSGKPEVEGLELEKPRTGVTGVGGEGQKALASGRCATKGQQTEDPCLKYKKSVRCQGVATENMGKDKASGQFDRDSVRTGPGGGTGADADAAGSIAAGSVAAGSVAAGSVAAGSGAAGSGAAGSGAAGSGAAGAGAAGLGAGAGGTGGDGAGGEEGAGAAACKSEGKVCKPKVPECAMKKFKSCGSLPKEKSPCSRLSEVDANIARQRKLAASQGLAAYIKNVVMCDKPCNKSAALTVIEEMLCTIQRQQRKTRTSECNTTGEEKDLERLRSIIDDYRAETEELRNQISQAYCTENKHKKLIIQQSERINQLELWASADRNELDRLKRQLNERGEETQAYHEMIKDMMKDMEHLKLQNYEQLNAQQEYECQMNKLEQYERELCKVKQERDGLRKKLQKSNCCQEVQVDKDREKLDKMLCQLGECQRNADMKERELNSLHKEIECLKAAKNKKEREMEWALSKVKGELDKKECIIKQFGNQLVQLQNQLQERECRLSEAENSLMEMREQMFELKVKFDANRDEVDKLYEQLCEKGKSLQDLQEQTSNSFNCSC